MKDERPDQAELRPIPNPSAELLRQQIQKLTSEILHLRDLIRQIGEMISPERIEETSAAPSRFSLSDDREGSSREVQSLELSDALARMILDASPTFGRDVKKNEDPEAQLPDFPF